MKGYVHTTKQLMVGQHNVTVRDGVREIECDLRPVAADLSGATVYESHEAALNALHAHHDDLEQGVHTLDAAIGKTRSARRGHDKGETHKAGPVTAQSFTPAGAPLDRADKDAAEQARVDDKVARAGLASDKAEKASDKAAEPPPVVDPPHDKEPNTKRTGEMVADDDAYKADKAGKKKKH